MFKKIMQEEGIIGKYGEGFARPLLEAVINYGDLSIIKSVKQDIINILDIDLIYQLTAYPEIMGSCMDGFFLKKYPKDYNKSTYLKDCCDEIINNKKSAFKMSGLEKFNFLPKMLPALMDIGIMPDKELEKMLISMSQTLDKYNVESAIHRLFVSKFLNKDQEINNIKESTLNPKKVLQIWCSSIYKDMKSNLSFLLVKHFEKYEDGSIKKELQHHTKTLVESFNSLIKAMHNVKDIASETVSFLTIKDILNVGISCSSKIEDSESSNSNAKRQKTDNISYEDEEDNSRSAEQSVDPDTSNQMTNDNYTQDGDTLFNHPEELPSDEISNSGEWSYDYVANL